MYNAHRHIIVDSMYSKRQSELICYMNMSESSENIV